MRHVLMLYSLRKKAEDIQMRLRDLDRSVIGVIKKQCQASGTIDTTRNY